MNGVATSFVYDLGGRAVSEFAGNGGPLRGVIWRGPQREATPRPALMSLGPGAGRSARPAYARAGLGPRHPRPALRAYLGGRHLATYYAGTTYFDYADWLGTERARAAYNGGPYESCSSLPYGDMLGCGYASSGPGDATELHFTGKMRDAATNLDYFGARYYSAASGGHWGRFMTPDPLLNSGKPWDPQSWDRYSYTEDNPVTDADPTGLYVWAKNCKETAGSACKRDRDRFRAALANLAKADAALKKGSRERRVLDRVLKRVGKEGKGDVKVAFGDAGHDKSGAPDLGKTEGNTITLNWAAQSAELKGYESAAADAARVFMGAYDSGLVAHEGGHLSSSGFGPLQFLMRSERTALYAESAVYQGLEFDDRVYKLWNPSWSAHRIGRFFVQ